MSDKTETKLLNCPFCGGEVYLLKRGNSIAHYVVICEPCRAEVKGTQPENAITKWNTRTDSAEQAFSDERRRIAENVSVPLSLEPGLDVLHMLAAYLRKEFAAEIAGTTDPE